MGIHLRQQVDRNFGEFSSASIWPQNGIDPILACSILVSHVRTYVVAFVFLVRSFGVGSVGLRRVPTRRTYVWGVLDYVRYVPDVRT